MSRAIYVNCSHLNSGLNISNSRLVSFKSRVEYLLLKIAKFVLGGKGYIVDLYLVIFER